MRRTTSDRVESRLATAATVAGRATLFGLGIALVVPPTSAENVVRAIVGCAGPMMLWWFFGGPGPRENWVVAAAGGLANLAGALMFARLVTGLSV